MKINTSELKGPGLDWAAAVADGRKPEAKPVYRFQDTPQQELIGYLIYTDRDEWDDFGRIAFVPSREDRTATPIIDREHISTIKQGGQWTACWYDANDLPRHTQQGNTRRIAALRCFIEKAQGLQVEIPDCLVGFDHNWT